MLDDIFTFLLFSPLWLGSLILLAIGSRSRGLARPLWNAERVSGTVVGHDRWLMSSGRERIGIVVDFVDEFGRPGRLVEPPVRWERPPSVGSTVRVSHHADDLAFCKRYSRRQQVAAWVATLVSMPIVVLFLASFPLFMSLVIAPHVAWLAIRRWNPPAAPVRLDPEQAPFGSASSGAPPFDPRSMVVPTAPPVLGETVDRVRTSVGDHRLERPVVPLGEAVRRHLFSVVSFAVILGVAVVGATRATHERAVAWHLALTLVLMIGVLLFETSLAYRGGSVAAGTVVDHVHRRDSEGDVYWVEVVEFPSERGLVTFVDNSGRRRQRPLGSTVSVSYRPGEPERARGLHRSQSVMGTVMIASAVGVGLFLSAPTWVPVLAQTVVCYLGFIVLDLVRGSTAKASERVATA